MSTFANPIDNRHARACRYCAHYGGEISGGVWCLHDPHVCAAGMGCVFFLRETGADDDLDTRQESLRRFSGSAGIAERHIAPAEQASKAGAAGTW